MNFITKVYNMKKVLVVLVVALSIMLVKFSNKIVELEYKIRILECEIMHHEYDVDTGISCEEVALED